MNADLLLISSRLLWTLNFKVSLRVPQCFELLKHAVAKIEKKKTNKAASMNDWTPSRLQAFGLFAFVDLGKHLKTKYMQDLLLFSMYDLTTQGSEPWTFGCPET